MTLIEEERRTDIFQLLLEAARKGNGKEIEIATFANDTVSSLRKVSSCFGASNEMEIDKALTEFVQELVPERESRETLEKGFEEGPDRVAHHSHDDEDISEWDTVIDGIVIGIKAVRDQRGESVRTWYLRSGEASDHEVSFLQEEKGPFVSPNC